MHLLFLTFNGTVSRICFVLNKIFESCWSTLFIYSIFTSINAFEEHAVSAMQRYRVILSLSFIKRETIEWYNSGDTRSPNSPNTPYLYHNYYLYISHSIYCWPLCFHVLDFELHRNRCLSLLNTFYCEWSYYSETEC